MFGQPTMRRVNHREDVKKTPAQRKADAAEREARIQLLMQAYECIECDLPEEERSKKEWEGKPKRGKPVRWRDADMSIKQDFLGLADIAAGIQLQAAAEPPKHDKRKDGRKIVRLVDDGWGEPYELTFEVLDTEKDRRFNAVKLARAMARVQWAVDHANAVPVATAVARVQRAIDHANE